jgi:hypothetical protein
MLGVGIITDSDRGTGIGSLYHPGERLKGFVVIFDCSSFFFGLKKKHILIPDVILIV